jgi:hypothetical protein
MSALSGAADAPIVWLIIFLYEGTGIMKHAVSVSLGSSTRDKRVEIELLGERVLIERMGTDGNVAQAAALYRSLDGKVDAFGMGGIDLSAGTPVRDYPIYAARKLICDVKHTPVVDGRGLKFTLERQCVSYVETHLGAEIQPKRAMVNVAADRYGMALSLSESGYACVYGDLLFALGIPVPLHTLEQVHWMLRLLGPIAGRLPIAMLYPVGEKQHHTVPRFTRWYRWATVIAGDCSYTKRHMPSSLEGKTILTNTTTEADVVSFTAAGVRYLVTTTPRFNGRSFGTNMMEAALVAVAGKKRALTRDELATMIAQLAMHPHIMALNA